MLGWDTMSQCGWCRRTAVAAYSRPSWPDKHIQACQEHLDDLRDEWRRRTAGEVRVQGRLL